MSGNRTLSRNLKTSRMITEMIRVKIDEIGERETTKALVNHVKKLGIFS